MGSASPPAPVTLVRRLAERAAGLAPGPPPQAIPIAVENYTSEQRLAREKSGLFRRLPLIIAHENQLPDPGDTLVHDWLGLPLITTRDREGNIGTFLNVCRHRGMRLVHEPGQTALHALVCPYHQWTYELDGRLRGVPLQESFAGIDRPARGLVRLPTEVRHGLVWVQVDGGADMDLDHHLAGLGVDLDRFGFPALRFCRQHARLVACNWKLIQDAFLDGYHVTRLHRNTVGPFFADSMAESDRIGRHFRSAVARRDIFEAVDLPAEQWDLREQVSFSYTVFPNSVLILHPVYTSIISLFPRATDQTLFVHSMLSPHPLETEEQRDHFERSFELIDQGVFQAEDIHVSEGIQQGLHSGANRELLFGGNEVAAADFHRLLDEVLATS